MNEDIDRLRAALKAAHKERDAVWALVLDAPQETAGGRLLAVARQLVTLWKTVADDVTDEERAALWQCLDTSPLVDARVKQAATDMKTAQFNMRVETEKAERLGWEIKRLKETEANLWRSCKRYEAEIAEANKWRKQLADELDTAKQARDEAQEAMMSALRERDEVRAMLAAAEAKLARMSRAEVE